jgi:hypothetical protein
VKCIETGVTGPLGDGRLGECQCQVMRHGAIVDGCSNIARSQ